MKKLLQLLEDDCTLTHAQLASMSGLTEAEVAAAIKKYEEERVILGYTAIVDWDRTDRESVTDLDEGGDAIPPLWIGTAPTGRASPPSSRSTSPPSGVRVSTGWLSASTSTTRWSQST